MGKRRAAMFFANNSQSLRVVSLIASIERAACSEPARLTVEIESFNYRRMWPPGKSRLLRRLYSLNDVEFRWDFGEQAELASSVFVR